MLKEIQQLAMDIKNEVIQNRRHLHEYPELSFCEFTTAAFVKDKLDQIGIPWQPVANTGILATITGEKKSSECIVLRADIDALPITETNDIAYASKNKGVMHACGHDAHTSSLLGTARILSSLKNKFGGTVKLIFQPGEEKLPGGANMLIGEGVFEKEKPCAIIGQHVMPSLECGKIALRKGKHMASMDEIIMHVRGKGGHGAQPHQNIDPVLITSHIIIAIQQVVSRMANPSTPTVLSFGKLIANGAINIIPDEVYIEGTFRTMDEKWRMEAHRRIIKMAKEIAESMGGYCECRIVKGYPVLINEDDLTEQLRYAAEEYLGKENVLEADLWMAAEDFAYYSQVADSCFYLLGVGNKNKGIDSALHTSTFNIDENVFATSTGLMAYFAIKRLKN